MEAVGPSGGVVAQGTATCPQQICPVGVSDCDASHPASHSSHFSMLASSASHQFYELLDIKFLFCLKSLRFISVAYNLER